MKSRYFLYSLLVSFLAHGALVMAWVGIHLSQFEKKLIVFNEDSIVEIDLEDFVESVHLKKDIEKKKSFLKQSLMAVARSEVGSEYIKGAPVVEYGLAGFKNKSLFQIRANKEQVTRYQKMLGDLSTDEDFLKCLPDRSNFLSGDRDAWSEGYFYMSTYLAQKQTPLKLKGLRFDAPYLRMNEARLAAYSYLQISERGHHSISALLMIAKIALLNGNETEAFEAYSAGIEEVAIASQVQLEKEVATVLGHGLVQFAKRNGGDITLLKEPSRGAKTGLHFEGRKVKLVLSRSQK